MHTIAFVLAHPDDETFCAACLIRGLSDEGHRPVLLLATKGEAGKPGKLGPLSKEQLAAVREKEMAEAAELLGITAVEYLDYPDGRLDEADPEEVAERIRSFLRKHEASVVLTFPENGNNGHRDHIAIHRYATNAVLAGEVESVKKLYYFAPTGPESSEQCTVRVDTKPHWPFKASVLSAHVSQALAVERVFGDLSHVKEELRYESFKLVWEKGGSRLPAKEQSILDRLGTFTKS